MPAIYSLVFIDKADPAHVMRAVATFPYRLRVEVLYGSHPPVLQRRSHDGCRCRNYVGRSTQPNEFRTGQNLQMVLVGGTERIEAPGCAIRLSYHRVPEGEPHIRLIAHQL